MLAPRRHLGPERLPVGQVIVDDLQRGDGALAEAAGGGGVGGRQCRHEVPVVVLQKVPSEANPKVRNHGEGPY